jgi:hypothetical protein
MRKFVDCQNKRKMFIKLVLFAILAMVVEAKILRRSITLREIIKSNFAVIAKTIIHKDSHISLTVIQGKE